MLINWHCAAPFYKLLLNTNTEYKRGERKEARISSWAPRGSISSLKTDSLLWGKRRTRNTTLLIPARIQSNTLNSNRNLRQVWEVEPVHAGNERNGHLNPTVDCNYLKLPGLTVCRCRSCGKRSFSQRGVCCWAPGPGSVPRPGAPSLRGSEAEPCSWSGFLNRCMEMTRYGVVEGNEWFCDPQSNLESLFFFSLMDMFKTKQ